MYNNEKELCENVKSEKPPIQNEVDVIKRRLEACEKVQAELISRLNIVLNQDSAVSECKEDTRIEASIPLCIELRNISDRLSSMNNAFYDTLDRLGI